VNQLERSGPKNHLVVGSDSIDKELSLPPPYRVRPRWEAPLSPGPSPRPLVILPEMNLTPGTPAAMLTFFTLN
jgi:hypothetical protein